MFVIGKLSFGKTRNDSTRKRCERALSCWTGAQFFPVCCDTLFFFFFFTVYFSLLCLPPSFLPFLFSTFGLVATAAAAAASNAKFLSRPTDRPTEPPPLESQKNKILKSPAHFFSFLFSFLPSQATHSQQQQQQQQDEKVEAEAEEEFDIIFWIVHAPTPSVGTSRRQTGSTWFFYLVLALTASPSSPSSCCCFLTLQLLSSLSFFYLQISLF